MIVRNLLSVGLLACLVVADPIRHIPTKFITRSHTQNGGELEYDGVYIYKNGHSRKLLDGGRAYVVSYLPYITAYIAGKHGIYFYNDETEKIEKYGTIDDSIIGIDKEEHTESLYILTEDNTVYKITERGTEKSEIPEAKGAQQIVLDNDDNLYFYGADKHAYVIVGSDVRKVEGLPADAEWVFFIKSLNSSKQAAMFLSDKGLFVMKPDATSSQFGLNPEEEAFLEKNRREAAIAIESLNDIL